jgi:hypothetical protein
LYPCLPESKGENAGRRRKNGVIELLIDTDFINENFIEPDYSGKTGSVPFFLSKLIMLIKRQNILRYINFQKQWIASLSIRKIPVIFKLCN